MPSLGGLFVDVCWANQNVPQHSRAVGWGVWASLEHVWVGPKALSCAQRQGELACSFVQAPPSWHLSPAHAGECVAAGAWGLSCANRDHSVCSHGRRLSRPHSGRGSSTRPMVWAANRSKMGDMRTWRMGTCPRKMQTTPRGSRSRHLHPSQRQQSQSLEKWPSCRLSPCPVSLGCRAWAFCWMGGWVLGTSYAWEMLGSSRAAPDTERSPTFSTL